jgi:hypothetical protein
LSGVDLFLGRLWLLLGSKLFGALFHGFLIGLREVALVVPRDEGRLLVGWVGLDLLEPLLLLLLFSLLQEFFLLHVNLLKLRWFFLVIFLHFFNFFYWRYRFN